MAVIMGSIKILPLMACEKCALNLKIRHLEKSKKTGYLKSLLQPFCTSMKLCTLILWSSPVLASKSTRICLNNFGDNVIQVLKSGKTQKVASFPCRGRKNVRIYSWYSLPDFKHHQKRSIRISSLTFPLPKGGSSRPPKDFFNKF